MQKCSICFIVFYLLYCETAFRPLYLSPIDKEPVTYGSGSVTQGDLSIQIYIALYNSCT